MKVQNPHAIYVDNGLRIRGLKDRISKLQSSIAILETKKGHPEVAGMKIRLDALCAELGHRRELQQELMKGYDYFREAHPEVFTADDPLSLAASPGSDNGGTPPSGERVQGEPEETEPASS